MAEFWKTVPSGENHAGFSITNSKLQIVEINFKDNNYVLENVDEVYFNEKLNLQNDKETKIIALIQNAFNELILKKPLKSNKVSFSLPFESFLTMQVPYDNTLLHQDLLDEFKWELSVLYPYISTSDLVIQYHEIEKNILNNTDTALVFAVPRKYLRILNDFCRQNKLKLKFVDHTHITSEKALSVTNNLTDKGIVLSIYLNYNYFSIIFSVRGKLVYHNVIAYDDAAEIPSLIMNEIDSNKIIKIDRGLINSGFITGEDISGSFASALGELLNIDLIRFNPFDKVRPVSHLLNNKYFLEKNNSFSPAAGIAYRLG